MDGVLVAAGVRGEWVRGVGLGAGFVWDLMLVRTFR